MKRWKSHTYRFTRTLWKCGKKDKKTKIPSELEKKNDNENSNKKFTIKKIHVEEKENKKRAKRKTTTITVEFSYIAANKRTNEPNTHTQAMNYVHSFIPTFSHSYSRWVQFSVQFSSVFQGVAIVHFILLNIWSLTSVCRMDYAYLDVFFRNRNDSGFYAYFILSIQNKIKKMFNNIFECMWVSVFNTKCVGIFCCFVEFAFIVKQEKKMEKRKIESTKKSSENFLFFVY